MLGEVTIGTAESTLSDWVKSLETENLDDAFRATAPWMRAAFADNFNQTKGPGYTWQPHAPLTILLYGPHPLLILYGPLKASVTQEGAPGSIEEYDGRSLTLGSTIIYAAAQQFGMGRIPARRYVWADGDFVDRATEAFAAKAFEILVGA